MSRLLAVAASLLLLVGCNESSLSNLLEGEVGSRVVVSPEALHFGALQEGDEEVQTFLITNVGTTGVRIEDLVIEGPQSFVVLDDWAGFVLAEGTSQSVEVLFSPVVADDNVANLVVHSDDPVAPEQHLDLLGTGTVPELVIDPDPYDFGTAFVGCTGEVEVSLRNEGVADLRIDDLSYEDPTGQLSLDHAHELPLTVAPGSEARVWVDFQSLSQAASTGTLFVDSNDPRGEVTGTQTADGLYASYLTEEFVVPEDPPVDVLFAVDQSCSMTWHANQLADAFEDLITEMSQVTSGWQIGVVTTDDGCLKGGILTPSTPNLISTFSQAVVDRNGSLSLTEKLFHLTEIALSKTSPGQCNAGFLRDDALLHIVHVSDEFEQSMSNGFPRDSTDHQNAIAYAPTYVDVVRSYKASDSLVKVSGLICEPGGCYLPNGDFINDGYDYGYAEAIDLTGGLRLDVMAEDWFGYAEQIATASTANIYHFPLSSPAHEPSLEVWVDGVEWTEGWTYDPVANEVVFDTHPPDGADLEIAYGVAVTCN